MKITDITQQKHNKSRMSVFVDGEYSFSLEDTDIIFLGIKVGREITEEEIKEYNQRCNYTKAFSLALDLISRKSATKKQINEKLKKSGYDEDIVTMVCDELKSMGYLDDVEYAREFAKDMISYKKQGKTKIIMELKNRGISQDDIREALSDMDFCEEDSISEHLLKKFSQSDLTDMKSKEKAMRYLLYRGFSPSDASEGIARFVRKQMEE